MYVLFRVTRSFITITFVVTSCFRFHRQSRVQSLTQKLSEDRRSPVLLLRSFDDAKKRTKISKTNLKFINNSSLLENKFYGYTLDELLNDTIEKEIGPLISLGDPNDYLPSLGSAKLYMPDSVGNKKDIWWNAIEELIDKAQLIIVFESKGENIYRELEYIHNNVNPHKVLFLTYPEIFNTSDSLWYAFKESCEKVGIILPTICVGKNKVISFDQEWNTQISINKNENPFDVVSELKLHIEKI